MRKLFVYLFCVTVLLPQWACKEKKADSEKNYSKLIYPGKDGKLVYEKYTPEGDVVPDFSYCGYKGGGVALPDVEVKITLEPGDFSKDDAPRIQEAIEKLGKENPDKNGFRGAILLKKGKYNIGETISLPYSGIVLKGEGNSQEGTVLVGTAKKSYTIISVGDNDKRIKDDASEQQITDVYVPSGTSVITVADVSGFKAGDEVVVERPSTKEWISAIGMDKLEDYWIDAALLQDKSTDIYGMSGGTFSADGKKYNSTLQWQPGSKNLFFERTIKSIDGNKITLDIPLVNALQKEYGGGIIYKYSMPKRIQQVGIENMYAEAIYDEKVTKEDVNVGTYCCDEQHASRFVSFNACQNSWAKDLTCIHLDNGYLSGAGSKFITIQDCEFIDPISILIGRRRYAFTFNGQMALVQRCYSRNARHDFVIHATVAGPNAFVDSRSEMSHLASEPHHRWAVGGLYDNCSLSGPNAHFSIANRGRIGSGHGWAGAQMVIWNCKSRLAILMKPPTAQNFAIGFENCSDQWSTPELISLPLNRINGVAKTDFPYVGIPVVGDGYIESPEKYVSPQYLYYQQVWDRLGKDAVMAITTKEQQKVIFGK